MAFAVVDIANLALMMLGEEAIGSMDESSPRAETCANFYDHTVEEVLRLHDWNCARARAELAQLVETPAMEWSYFYQLPVDCLAIRKAQDSGGQDGYPWEREANRLVTDMEEVFIVYTRDINVPALFDSTLRSAIAARLAWYMAYKLTQSRALQKEALSQFGMIMASSVGADAAEGLKDSSMDGVATEKSWVHRT